MLTYQLKLSASDKPSSFASKIVEMQDLCDSETYQGNPRMTDLTGTVDVSVYKYKLKFIDFPDAKGIDIIFHDIPGEHVEQGNTEELDVLEEIAKKCQIIIVAVDTPALLWAYKNGHADQEFITAAESLQSLFADLGKCIDANLPEDNKSLKSIIFAPIKCESFIGDKNFYSYISKAIDTAYNGVIEEAHKSRCKVSIIPMQTIGGVKFHHYSLPEEMFVLKYGPNVPTNDENFKKNREYETEEAGEEDTLSYITRCERNDAHSVRIARSGNIYRLREGDALTPTADMPGSPYVFEKNHPLPYIWYQATGTGFKQEKCERVMYEVIKLTIQQIAATGKYTIKYLLENQNDGFLIRLLRVFLKMIGITLKTDQLKGLCKALQSMHRNGVFNDSIVLLNNIDPNPDSPLRIP